MTRDEIITLIVAKAREYEIEPWEFLGGAIAESELNPTAWRQGAWPDWSAGLFQQTVKFADEGDQSASPANVALIRRLYFDPVHACDVAARKYRYWRHDPEVPALTAWVAYNSPALYHTPDESPNVENYRRGLAEAKAILGAAPMPTPRVRYNPNEPAHPQEDDFDCSQESLEWALYSLGRSPQENWLEPTMIAEGVISPQRGLLDASGAGLAAFVRRQYGEFGFDASYNAVATFDMLAREAGRYPLLAGGRTFGPEGHWVGVRGYDQPRGVLLLANPANGYTGIGQEMTRAQWDARGPWSMVRITHPDLAAADPEPLPGQPPSADPLAPWINAVAYLGDDVADRVAHRAELLRSEAAELDAIAAELRRVRVERVGPRP